MFSSNQILFLLIIVIFIQMFILQSDVDWVLKLAKICPNACMVSRHLITQYFDSLFQNQVGGPDGSMS